MRPLVGRRGQPVHLADRVQDGVVAGRRQADDLLAVPAPVENHEDRLAVVGVHVHGDFRVQEVLRQLGLDHRLGIRQRQPQHRDAAVRPSPMVPSGAPNARPGSAARPATAPGTPDLWFNDVLFQELLNGGFGRRRASGPPPEPTRRRSRGSRSRPYRPGTGRRSAPSAGRSPGSPARPAARCGTAVWGSAQGVDQQDVRRFDGVGRVGGLGKFARIPVRRSALGPKSTRSRRPRRRGNAMAQTTALPNALGVFAAISLPLPARISGRARPGAARRQREASQMVQSLQSADSPNHEN